MAAMIGLIVTLVLFPLAGLAFGRRSIGEAFLLGAGITGTVLFVAGVVHVPLVIAMVVLGAWTVGRGAWVLKKGFPLTTPHSALPTILMCIPLLALAFGAAIMPLNDFDGRAFWALKAKGIAHERSIDGPFFHGGTHDPRNQYPVLIPLDGAVILSLAHSLDDRNLRWLYLGILAALALLVRERIGRLVSPAAGAWCAALLVWIPQFAVEPEGGALSAYNDIAIAAFAAGAFFDLLDADARKSEIRFGLWLAFLVLTKSEGLPLALVFLAIGAFVFRKRILAPSIIAFIATLSLIVWRLRIPAGDEEDVFRLLPTLPEKLHRLGIAIAAFPRHMLLMPRWGVLWIAVIIAGIIAARLDRRAWLAIAMIASILALYAAVYVTTAWVPSELIAVTADRLLMHVIAPSLFLLAVAGRANRTSAAKPS
ncbi:MAG: hypothetical protein JO093_11435 [Acidobacteria bacterium]|nr:hypothetical protein [Acidobacteriota bacterium]MBV9067827.1 hypothetical protein [Acidobacteriota bacterium]MBV9186230.1 hypothetical protein [Acidobacteriota bacterium]